MNAITSRWNSLPANSRGAVLVISGSLVLVCMITLVKYLAQSLPVFQILFVRCLFGLLALYLFGGEVLEGFAFTMLVGVISGTYSTIFIAAAAAIVISERRASRRAQVTSAPATAKSKRRSKKAHARARA